METFSASTGRIDLLSCIKSSCSYVTEQAQHVRVDEDRIVSLVSDKSGDFSDHLKMLLDKKNEWDVAGWHYNDDILEGGELTSQYIMVVDALNFCFWPCEGLEYEHLAIGLKKALQRDRTAFDAHNLMKATESTLREWIPDFDIPQISERVDRLRELGSALHTEYGGKVSNLVKQADHSAARLVDLVTRSFPGFRDTSVYRGRLIHFYKRAQIFVADLWGAFSRPTDPSHPYFFHDIDQVTMFADYRIPQILLHLQVLSYDSALMSKITGKHEIAFGSEEEIEIRASTVIAVQMMREQVRRHLNLSLTSIELDWILWNWGEVAKDNILPHHRTLTIYY